LTSPDPDILAAALTRNRKFSHAEIVTTSPGRRVRSWRIPILDSLGEVERDEPDLTS
jgi:hypothetical protein